MEVIHYTEPRSALLKRRINVKQTLLYIAIFGLYISFKLWNNPKFLESKMIAFVLVIVAVSLLFSIFYFLRLPKELTVMLDDEQIRKNEKKILYENVVKLGFGPSNTYFILKDSQNTCIEMDNKYREYDKIVSILMSKCSNAVLPGSVMLRSHLVMLLVVVNLVLSYSIIQEPSFLGLIVPVVVNSSLVVFIKIKKVSFI